MRRVLPILLVAGALVAGSAMPAAACAGLVTPGGRVRLVRTATLAAYANGVEHYVTSFTFEGGGAEFGAILPLPGVPSKVEKGGEWTLQRLAQEVAPPQAFGGAGAGGAPAAAPAARVVYETRIDALDITVLEGGGRSVGLWAKQKGFKLTPDTPEVLEFYGERSPYFLAARFDAKAARDQGQQVGEGTPIHLTIPTKNPWVPLRILGVGRQRDEIVNADVFLLTQRRPALLPVRAPGVTLQRREPATQQLLDDLRSDKGMGWIPQSMWLTHMTIDSTARDLRFDLAVDASGRGRPSRVAAGLARPAKPKPQRSGPAPSPSGVTSPTAAAVGEPSDRPAEPVQAAVPVYVVPAARSNRAVPVGLALAALLSAAGATWRARRS